MKYANASVRKAKTKVSKVCNLRTGVDGNIFVYGIGDASFQAGEKTMSGQFVVLGNQNSSEVLPLFCRSKFIQKVCKSPKDAKTII